MKKGVAFMKFYYLGRSAERPSEIIYEKGSFFVKLFLKDDFTLINQKYSLYGN